MTDRVRLSSWCVRHASSRLHYSPFSQVNLIVEGLARVDPSVSVFCDVQNTLVAPILLQYGTKEQRKKYLPRLHKDLVRLQFPFTSDSLRLAGRRFLFIRDWQR